MTYKEKISVARKRNIDIPDALASGEAIVGVYGFFAIAGEAEECFYIGKATNVAGRILGASNGHVYMYLQQNMTKYVPRKIGEYIERGYRIEVRILEQIDYHDTSFSRATHRLALAELQKIVEYQEKGQCLGQRPEEAGRYIENYWEKHYHIK